VHFSARLRTLFHNRDDREALELLLRSIQPSLRRYVLGLVGPSHADDVLQDVLILVARKLAWLEQL